MDVDNEERRAGAPAVAAGRRERWGRFVERATGLQLMAVYWVPMTVFLGLPVRWLFDRQDSLVEAVLGAALNTVWIGPSISLVQRVVGEARQDPAGIALRQALRTGTVPEDAAVRAELPNYLAGQWRATWAALLLVLGVCLGLVLLALLAADNEGFAVIFGLVAAVSGTVAALTLTRIRRLAALLAAPNPPGTP
ncbi:hypothetical protein [Micromonospora ureilytica]|uniref:FtsH-binding integral membrane protein n=1 Tax=Micromonospora ureilytica TaxID=709868 RepID=A0ABS0JJP5_9ACTN|nr:hypothetical protein [Micromonospora ureilytica]MBG6067259.1 FtsH-binding integral membrane protein [Micromonospora ureilytica]WSR59263.1 hypothetical protein OG400_14180 [Micromonospora ureilytica]